MERTFKSKKKKLRFQIPYGENKLEASKYVVRSLDGSDYGSGAVETAYRQAENVTAAFGRLIEVLSDKDLLTDDEVKLIAEGFA